MSCDCKDCTCEVNEDVEYAVDDVFAYFSTVLENTEFESPEKEQFIELLIAKLENYADETE